VTADCLSAALSPGAIAVVGASDNPNKIGGRTLLYLSRFGYKGKVYPINSLRRTVQGLRAYPDVAALPEAPDLAVVAAPAPHVIQAVDDCAARGVRATIVMASGFGETADASAIAAERQMVARARAAGMRIVGPNSQGLANFGTGAVASFSTMFLEVVPADGPVGIVSQSGMMSVVPYGLLRAKGIGVRHAHATGNDADVTLAEIALNVVSDPGVRLLLLYIESIRDSETLARAAAIARDRDVPIVAVKTGRTVRGQAAARSHTGALANEDRVVQAFFREHGIWRVRDVHELVNAAGMYLKGWRPKGRKLVVVSNSGATCVMAADTAQDVKLELAPLAADTVKTLATRLPSFATTTNPIDITAALLTNSDLFGQILSTVADDAHVDLLFVGIPVAGTGYDVSSFAKAAADYAEHTNKPVAVAAPQESVARRFCEAGVPVFENETDAISALAQLTHHTRLMRRRFAKAEPHATISLPVSRSRFLSESQSLQFLGMLGLPVVPHRLCHSEHDAKAAFSEFGGPVALKACSPEVPHKSDHGLVMLGIDNEHDVGRAFSTLESNLKALGVTIEGVIVAPMVGRRREFMLGAKVDAVFGPVLIVGDGGRYVETLGDFETLMAPTHAELVREALSSLRIAPLLEGVRGEPPLDIEPLCRAAVRLSQIIAAGVGQIASIDLNPILVGERGEGIAIVDALVEQVVDNPSLVGAAKLSH